MFELRDETGDIESAQEIERNLLVSLSKANTQSINSEIVLTLRSETGNLTGGLVAGTSYGWMLVKMLWVAADHRNNGHGRALMKQAEAVARQRECHSVWLETSSSSSYHFYRALGFECFGKLENTDGQPPKDHQRWFLRSTFSTK